MPQASTRSEDADLLPGELHFAPYHMQFDVAISQLVLVLPLIKTNYSDIFGYLWNL